MTSNNSKIKQLGNILRMKRIELLRVYALLLKRSLATDFSTLAKPSCLQKFYVGDYFPIASPSFIYHIDYLFNLFYISLVRPEGALGV
jgi:hypothetical protein